MEYTKLKIPFMERLTFLFTGLLPTKHLYIEPALTRFVSQLKEERNGINNIEENELKVDIPFFELDSTETTSNL